MKLLVHPNVNMKKLVNTDCDKKHNLGFFLSIENAKSLKELESLRSEQICGL